MSEKHIIFRKLDNFISAYYKNQLIKGILLTLVFAVALFLLIAISEYFFSFSTGVRTFLFYFLVISYLILFSVFILWPTLKVFRLSKLISYKDAAKIISGKFSGINDKLINLLELIGLEQNNSYSKALTLASIKQKTTKVQNIKFTDALDKKKNLEFLKYLGFVFLVFLILIIFKPDIITQSSSHLIQHDKEFVYQPQIYFEVLNKNLNIEKGKDFNLKVRVGGDFVPSKLKVNFSGNSFFMEKEADNEFSYTFKNLNNSLSIFVSSGKFSSEKYKLNVLPTPLIKDLYISVFPPKYTGEEPQTLENIGDLTLLSGSTVKWKIKTDNTNSLNFIFADSLKVSAKVIEDMFQYTKQFKKSQKYSVSVKNNFFEKKNYLTYAVKVIPDLFPSISLLQLRDSSNYSLIYFKGEISDDYGFSNLKFHYIIKNGKTTKKESVKIDINKNLKTQKYYFTFDFASLDLKPEQNIEYYFSVYDNDRPNGYKESKTTKEYFTVPSKEQITEFENSKSENIKSNAEKSNELIKELQKDIKKLQQKLINEKTSDWEKTKMLNEINKKNNELKELLKQISEENKEKNEFKNTFSETEESIRKKQEEIQQLMEELMTDELRELMKQIEELENEMDEEKLKNLSDKMDMTYKDIEEQLDRNLELLKRFEVEQKVGEVADDLKKLSKKQEELSEDLDKKNISKEEAAKEQNKLEKELDRVKKEYDKADELNKELKKSYKLEEFDKDFENIKQEMQNSQQNLNDNKNRKSQKSMKNSSQQMQNLAKKMENMMSKAMMKQNSEDMESLRLLLKNLVRFSKLQEDLMSKFTKVSNQDPKFAEYVNEQNKIKEDFQIIEDSLLALSKRVMQIKKPVTEEVGKVNLNLNKTLEILEDGRRGGYKTRQQYVMTSANNLALLLSEILDMMQNQQQQMGQGQGKSGKKQKPTLGEMQQMQQGLKEMMEQYLKSLKEGKGKKHQSQGLGKMLAKQEVMKKMLQDLKNNGSTGTQTQEFLKEIERLMNETENELINRNVNVATIERQKKIMDKLLKAEESEREKEKDEERKSKEARNAKISNPDFFKEELDKNNSIKEDLEISNLKLHHFYNEVYKKYINSLD